MAKRRLLLLRYLFSFCVVIFAILIFCFPLNRIYLGLMTLSLSFVMLVQSTEIKSLKKQNESQFVLSTLSAICCLAVSIYIFSKIGY